MNKIVIMHFIESEGLYGAETVLLNLSLQMKSSDVFKPLVGCIVKREEEENELYQRALDLGIDAKKLVVRNTSMLSDLIATAKKLTKWEVALIHSHGYKPSIYGYILNRMTKISVTATCHLWFRDKRPFKFHVMTAIEVFLYRFFPTITAVSEPIRQHLIKKGIAAEKIKIIGNGIFVEKYKNDRIKRNRIREKLGIVKEEFVYTTVGRLNEQKNHEVFIDAAGKINNREGNSKFIIVGEGPLKGKLEQRIKNNNLSEKVLLLGFRKDIDDLLRASDAFVLTSKDEGLPMSFLEAASSQVPIISTEVGNIPKILSDGETGYYIRKDDPEHTAKLMAYVQRNKAEAKKVARAAYELVKKEYSTQKMFAEYEKIYISILYPSSLAREITKKEVFE